MICGFSAKQSGSQSVKILQQKIKKQNEQLEESQLANSKLMVRINEAESKEQEAYRKVECLKRGYKKK